MTQIQVLRDIHKTVKETIEILTRPLFEGDADIWVSKFGGIPYFPKNLKYPCDNSGNPMYLLAQINCVDMPSFKEPFPKEGLLQFYIRNDDDHGVNFDDPNDRSGYCVLHIPHPQETNALFHPNNFRQTQSDLSFLEKPVNYFPVEYPHKIGFSLTSTLLPETNPHFEEIYAAYFKEPDFIELYATLLRTDFPHRMGGYISLFPDYLADTLDEYILLLQIGSTHYINFGDAREGVFLIKKEDLLKKDFSHVVYYWLE